MSKKTKITALIAIPFILFSCASDQKKKDEKKIKDGIGEIFWDDDSLKGKGPYKNYQKQDYCGEKNQK